MSETESPDIQPDLFDAGYDIEAEELVKNMSQDNQGEAS